jgi:hypothetical protein
MPKPRKQPKPVSQPRLQRLSPFSVPQGPKVGDQSQTHDKSPQNAQLEEVLRQLKSLQQVNLQPAPKPKRNKKGKDKEDKEDLTQVESWLDTVLAQAIKWGPSIVELLGAI